MFLENISRDLRDCATALYSQHVPIPPRVRVIAFIIPANTFGPYLNITARPAAVVAPAHGGRMVKGLYSFRTLRMGECLWPISRYVAVLVIPHKCLDGHNSILRALEGLDSKIKFVQNETRTATY